jgi:BirA family transcriptional regulator, biotin operon repressor / biotin---[acetyl-CoA-carboxylase] ligase
MLEFLRSKARRAQSLCRNRRERPDSKPVSSLADGAHGAQRQDISSRLARSEYRATPPSGRAADLITSSQSLVATDAAGISLARILADGRWHSEAEIESSLIPPAAFGAELRALEAFGLPVRCGAGRVYCLIEPLEFLESSAIRCELDRDSRAILSGLEIRDVLDSTNRYLLDRAAFLPGGWACLTEYQSAGRGRRGRTWFSPLAANLYLSILWTPDGRNPGPGGLSLAVGVAAARAVEEAGGLGVGLKWPNDLLWEGQKLGGVLVEAIAGPAGPSRLVVGLGLNLRMPAGVPAWAIDQPWVDLQGVLGRPISRNRIAGRLLHHVLKALRDHEVWGLGPFLHEWSRLDVTAGKPVTLHWADRALRGVALGVTQAGEIKLFHDGATRHYASGEVSLRLR